MVKNYPLAKKGNMVVALLLVLLMAFLLAIFFTLNKNKKISAPTGVEQTGSADAPAVFVQYPVANSSMDEQLKILDNEAKAVEQSLSDQPVDVLSE